MEHEKIKSKTKTAGYVTRTIHTDNWLWGLAIIAFCGYMICTYLLCLVPPFNGHVIWSTLAFLFAVAFCLGFVGCIIIWYNQTIEIKFKKTCLNCYHYRNCQSLVGLTKKCETIHYCTKWEVADDGTVTIAWVPNSSFGPDGFLRLVDFKPCKEFELDGDAKSIEDD